MELKDVIKKYGLKLRWEPTFASASFKSPMVRDLLKAGVRGVQNEGDRLVLYFDRTTFADVWRRNFINAYDDSDV